MAAPEILISLVLLVTISLIFLLKPRHIPAFKRTQLGAWDDRSMIMNSAEMNLELRNAKGLERTEVDDEIDRRRDALEKRREERRAH